MKFKQSISEFICDTKYKQILNDLSTYDTVDSYEGILNIHRFDKHNIGDIKSAPYNYFTELKNFEVLDILGYKRIFSNHRIWFKKLVKNKLIVGGGGLLNRKTFINEMKLLEYLAFRGHKIVLWGIGHNEAYLKQSDHVRAYSVDLNKFGLVGVRDYNMGYEWVPCSSCMDSLFDNRYKVDTEISFILHQNDRTDKTKLDSLKEFPILFNDETSFENVIEFIGKTDVLLTSSYHAMYWGLLMGKRVVVFPNSSKMFSFKYMPTICNDVMNFKESIKHSVSHSGLLDECRYINNNFAKRVFDFLEI